MLMIFFSGAEDERRRGRKAEMLWMTPSALVLYYKALESTGYTGSKIWGETYGIDEGCVELIHARAMRDWVSLY